MQNNARWALFMALVFCTTATLAAYDAWQHKDDLLVRTENNDWRRRTQQDAKIETWTMLGFSAVFLGVGVFLAIATLRSTNLYSPQERLSQTYNDFALGSSVEIGPFQNLAGRKLTLHFRYEVPWERSMKSFRLYPPTRLSPPLQYEIKLFGLNNNEPQLLFKRRIEHTDKNAEGASDIKWKIEDIDIQDACDSYVVEVTPIADPAKLIWPKSASSDAKPHFIFGIHVDVALGWKDARKPHFDIEHITKHAAFRLKSNAITT